MFSGGCLGGGATAAMFPVAWAVKGSCGIFFPLLTGAFMVDCCFFDLMAVLGWWWLVCGGGVWGGFGRGGGLGVAGGSFFCFGVVGGGLTVVGHGWSGRWGRQQKEEEEEKTLDFVVLVARRWRLIGRGPSELCRRLATPCLPVLPSKGPPFPN